MLPLDNSLNHVLLAPLDWGMGHATRCVPIIETLLLQGHEVTIAASGASQRYLMQRFETCSHITLQGWNMKYHRLLPVWATVLFQLPKIGQIYLKEKKWLKNTLKTGNYDAVISDNRYGLQCREYPCFILTHQTQPQTGLKLLDWPARLLVSFLLRPFKAIWIPDNPSSLYSGNLSRTLRNDVKYIGILSRLRPVKHKTPEQKYSILFLSGNSPKREIYAGKILESWDDSLQALYVLGEYPQRKPQDNIVYLGWQDDSALASLLGNASHIFMRSGYSSLMDVLASQSNATLVLTPTPGQGEQEYLARLWTQRHNAGTLSEHDISQAALRKILDQKNTSSL